MQLVIDGQEFICLPYCLSCSCSLALECSLSFSQSVMPSLMSFDFMRMVW